MTVKHGSKTDPWQIDAISGATISSKAVARMLNDSAQAMLPAINAHLDRLAEGAGSNAMKGRNGSICP